MSRAASRVLLWLFVINLGIAFGAGLYESEIVFPRWLVGSPENGYRWDDEAARADNTGLRFWVYVTTGPLTLITLGNLVAAWRHHGKARSWWLGASMFALADRVFALERGAVFHEGPARRLLEDLDYRKQILWL